MNYRNSNESKYFGSDFNKFLNSLSKEMTVINIDCLQYKRSLKKMRIIESKHLNEHVPYSQVEALRKLADALKKSDIGLVFEVLIVRGDYPYNKLKITSISKQNDFELVGQQVKDWCEFKEIEMAPSTENTPIKTGTDKLKWDKAMGV